MTRSSVLSISALLAYALTHGAVAASATPRERLALSPATLELPGAPAAIVPADLDGDGAMDLMVVVAYTEWDRIDFAERLEMGAIEGLDDEDRVEGLIEVLTVVPALLDRRELHVFLAGGSEADGGYRPLPPLELDTSVLSLAAGPAGTPAIALTDDGVARVELDGGPGPDPPRLRLAPWIDDPPALAGSRNFVADLGLMHRLDGGDGGDGGDDDLYLLLPAADGLAVYRLPSEPGATPQSRGRVPWPRAERDRPTGRLVRHLPRPAVRDLDGDGDGDLLMPSPRFGWNHPTVVRNLGGGAFAPPVRPLTPPPTRPDDPATVWLGDLDGDGVAEYVSEEPLADPEAGMRKSIAEAKRPPMRYRLYRSERGGDFGRAGEPYRTFETTGYAFPDSGGDGADDDGYGEAEIRIPGGLRDLDGDGRLDLIATTLDFSLLQAVRILATHSLAIGLDFHIWCQRATGDGGGVFEAVEGLDLSGRFKIRLDDLRLGHLSQFAGDFDGDGRADFVQMGRGEKVTVHLGRAGCRYPAEPDLVLELAEAPRNLSLVRIEDFDGDGLADIAVIRPRAGDSAGAGETTPGVSLDLYISGATP